VRNVLNTNTRREQEQEDAKAKQFADGIAKERAKAKANNPDKDYSDAQLKGAYQANRTAAHTAKTVRDLINRSNANSAKAQSQGLSLTPAQSLSHEIEKIRTQNKVNAAKAAQTKQARAVINLLAPTVIKALTTKPTAPVAAAAPISDAAIGDATQALKAAVKSIDPNKTFSFNELKEGSVNILSNNGKTSAVQDYLASNKPEQTLEGLRSQQSMVGEGVQVAEGPVYRGLEWALDSGVDILDRINNPDRNGWNHPGNNTYGVDGSTRAAVDALISEGAIHGGQAVSIGSNAVKGPLGTELNILGTQLEDAGRRKKKDFLSPDYRP